LLPVAPEVGVAVGDWVGDWVGDDFFGDGVGVGFTVTVGRCAPPSTNWVWTGLTAPRATALIE
jgi:hypothetical protein